MDKKTGAVQPEQCLAGVGKENKSKRKWQKPKLEDVSGKVMAQPYIRFT